MKNKRNVREFMFFQLLGMLPVMLAFKHEIIYSLIALIIAFLFYKLDPVIKEFCENISDIGKIFWSQIAVGFVLAGTGYLFSWVNTMLGLFWVMVFFIVGMFNAGKVQSFLDKGGDCS